MDLGLLYAALKTDRIDLAAANEGRRAGTSGVVMLEDDRHYFPPYEYAIAVRDDTLRRLPGLRAASAELSGRITGPAMRRMKEEVDVDHKAAADVARESLDEWK